MADPAPSDQKPDKPPKGDLPVKDTDPRGASLYGFNPWGIRPSDVMDLAHHIGSLRDALFPAQAPDPSLQHLFDADWAKKHPDQAGVKLADRDALQRSGDLIMSMIGDAPRGGLLGDIFHGASREWPAEPGHPLGRFDPRKILSGEGHHAEAWGGYVSQAREIAEWYRDQYGEWPAHEFGRAMDYLHGMGLTDLQISDLGFDPVWTAIDRGLQTGAQRGALYQLRYPGARRDEFLNWEKPIRAQSAKVRKVLEDMGYGMKRIAHEWDYTPVGELSGEELYNLIGEQFAGPRPSRPMGPAEAKTWRNQKQRWVSEQLHKAGIKGVDYEAGKSTDRRYNFYRNFVIFHPQSLRVIAKYGLGPVLGLGVMNALGDIGDQTQAPPQS